MFLAGPGGTGKSVVLREIIKNLSKKYNQGEWAAVASTGIAAVPISGQTLHKFAGCGVPVVKKDFGKCWDKRVKWRSLKVLVIEEISTVSGEFFDDLSEIVSKIREDNQISSSPFGGIQLLLCGDFLQLPPITKSIQEIKAKNLYTTHDDSLFLNKGFAFQSKAWKRADLKVVELDHIFRQDSKSFQNVLVEIRKGVISKGETFLRKCNRPLLKTSSGIKTTILYPKNKEVTEENLKELVAIPGPERYFEADDSVEADPPYDFDDYVADYQHLRKKQKLEEILWQDNFFNDCIANKDLRLKVNAQVMLIKNARR